MQEAKRLHSIQEYYFSTKLKEIARLQKAGKPIINLGIGSPDLPPPDKVIQTLKDAVNIPSKHSYQSYRGIPELRQAISNFYQKHYSVKLNYENEILPLIGSKEAIMYISMAFLNPGDAVLIPSIGYMTYTSATVIAEGQPVYYQIDEKHNYLPEFHLLEQQNLENVKIMWLNYPHMPTGATADLDFFQQCIDFARKHNILLVNDNPYSFILNDNPLSILQIPEAKNTAIELNSLSKSHNMAGWRIGMMLGSKEHIDAVVKFQSQMESGMFYGMQQAAVQALNIDAGWYNKLNKIYSERKKIVLQIADKLQLKYKNNQAGMFVWAKLPLGQASKDFTDKLLYDKNIFIAPGFIFGNDADAYVRISLTQNKKILTEALNRL